MSTANLSHLDEMTREQLITFIRCCIPEPASIALMTEDETADAMMLKLAIMAIKSDEAKTTLDCVNAWLDRKKGKAVQRIDQRVQSIHHTNAGELSTGDIMLALAGMQLPDGVKLIEGKVERVDSTSSG